MDLAVIGRTVQSGGYIGVVEFVSGDGVACIEWDGIGGPLGSSRHRIPVEAMASSPHWIIRPALPDRAAAATSEDETR